MANHQVEESNINIESAQSKLGIRAQIWRSLVSLLLRCNLIQGCTDIYATELHLSVNHNRCP